MTSQKTAEFGSAASSVKPIDSHARFIVVGVIVVGSFIALLKNSPDRHVTGLAGTDA